MKNMTMQEIDKAFRKLIKESAGRTPADDRVDLFNPDPRDMPILADHAQAEGGFNLCPCGVCRP